MPFRLIVFWTAAAFADAPATSSPPDPGRPALSLAQAEQLALRQQPTIRQAQGQAEAAAGRVEEARSGYLPQVTATAAYQRTTGNFSARPGAVVQTSTGTVGGMAAGMIAAAGTTSTVVWTPTFNYWTLGVSASQLIYDFNSTADRWRSASAGYDAAVASTHASETQALLAVRRAYFQALAQRDLARVAAEALENQQRHLEQIQAFVRAGIRSQIDLATARTAVANARVQMVTADNAEASARAILNQAMGVPETTTYQLTDGDEPPVPGEDGASAELIQIALRARPEIAAAEEQRRAQELTVSAFRGNYGPALSATGGLTDTGTTHLTPNWFVGLSASWAILQGGLTRGQIHEANGTLSALAAQVDAVRLQVGTDVEQARLAVRAAKATIDGAEEALTNAREQLRLAEGRYRTGLGSVIELADAQVAYTTAAAQEVSARYNVDAARAQLLAALGTR